MPESRHRTSVLEGISLQYELALSAGRSLDPGENCTEFLKALLTRKGLDATGVWVWGSQLGKEHDREHLWPFHFNPSFRTPSRLIPADDPVLERIAEAGPVAFRDGSFPGTGVTFPKTRGGEFAAFPLKRVGLLTIHSTRRQRSFSRIELRQLAPVVSKFALTLEGSLAHDRLIAEQHVRRSMEHALSESRGMYRALFQDAPCMFFSLDAEGIVRGVNRAGASALGYSADELLGSPVAHVFHADDREAVKASLAASLADPGAIHSWAFRKVTADGTLMHVQEFVRTTVGSDGSRQALVLCTDVTDRVAAERALSDSEARYRAVVQQSMDAIFLVDPGTGRIVEGNPALGRLLGYETEELAGLSVYELVDHPRDDVEGRIETIARRGSASLGRRRYRRRDGSSFMIEGTASLIRYGGRDAICVVARDMTTQIAAETERQEIEERLRHTQKLESLGVLAGGVAHDFNNILAGILGNADLAMTRLAPASEVRDFLTRIASASVQASALCTQLLDYAGKSSSRFEPTDVSSVIDHMMRIVAVTISKKAVVERHLDETLPSVMADAGQLGQVFLNLVTNASEALGEDAGTIAIRTGLLSPTRDELDGYVLGNVCEPGNYVYVEIQDSGVGMTPDQRSRMFDPFFTTKFTGRGLGLATVLGIVRSHAGAIQIGTSQGGGTSIRVLFPVAVEANMETQDAEPSPSRSALRVVVADDDDEVRLVTRMALEDAGMAVLEASDGRAAVDLVLSNPDAVDVVLLDVTMPRMGGREALDEIRVLRPDLPVVLCSGYDENQTLAGLSGSHRSPFIKKPFRLQTLVTVVHDAAGTPGASSRPTGPSAPGAFVGGGDDASDDAGASEALLNRE